MEYSKQLLNELERQRRQKNNRSNLLGLLIIAIIALFFVAGCGGGDECVDTCFADRAQTCGPTEFVSDADCIRLCELDCGAEPRVYDPCEDAECPDTAPVCYTYEQDGQLFAGCL